jgi:mycothiol synthase
MERPTLSGVADFALPTELEIRPVRPEQYRSIWDAHLRAFRTHWGFSPPDEADYQRWLPSKVFQPHVWQVAWDQQTGEVAGRVRGYIAEDWNVANGRKRGCEDRLVCSHQVCARALRAVPAVQDLSTSEST